MVVLTKMLKPSLTVISSRVEKSKRYALDSSATVGVTSDCRGASTFGHRRHIHSIDSIGSFKYRLSDLRLRSLGADRDDTWARRGPVALFFGGGGVAGAHKPRSKARGTRFGEGWAVNLFIEVYDRNFGVGFDG